MKEELIELLREKAYRTGDFTLSSGKKSKHYVNCKPVTLNGEGLYYAAVSLLDLVKPDVKAVAGLTLGADPLVSAVTMHCYQVWRPLDGLIIRKEPKGHGTASQIEGPLGNIPKGSKIVVLEDVTTTGASSLKAAKVLRDYGFVVELIATVLDRQEGAAAAIAAEGLELQSLITMEELLCESKP